MLGRPSASPVGPPTAINVGRYSERVCIRCGEPAQLRNVRWRDIRRCEDCELDDCDRHPRWVSLGGWVRPECDGCWRGSIGPAC